MSSLIIFDVFYVQKAFSISPSIAYHDNIPDQGGIPMLPQLILLVWSSWVQTKFQQCYVMGLFDMRVHLTQQNSIPSVTYYRHSDYMVTGQWHCSHHWQLLAAWWLHSHWQFSHHAAGSYQWWIHCYCPVKMLSLCHTDRIRVLLCIIFLTWLMMECRVHTV